MGNRLQGLEMEKEPFDPGAYGMVYKGTLNS